MFVNNNMPKSLYVLHKRSVHIEPHEKLSKSVRFSQVSCMAAKDVFSSIHCIRFLLPVWRCGHGVACGYLVWVLDQVLGQHRHCLRHALQLLLSLVSNNTVILYRSILRNVPTYFIPVLQSFQTHPVLTKESPRTKLDFMIKIETWLTKRKKHLEIFEKAMENLIKK